MHTIFNSNGRTEFKRDKTRKDHSGGFTPLRNRKKKGSGHQEFELVHILSSRPTSPSVESGS